MVQVNFHTHWTVNMEEHRVCATEVSNVITLCSSYRVVLQQEFTPTCDKHTI